MKRFQMVANVTFSAPDIEGALRRLSRHFTEVAHGRDSTLFEPYSKIDIRPVE